MSFIQGFSAISWGRVGVWVGEMMGNIDDDDVGDGGDRCVVMVILTLLLTDDAP